MELKNRTLSNFADLVQTGECKKFKGRLKVGVDLGTANTVLAVVDTTNRPIAGISAPSQAIRDGVIVNYYESVQLVTRLKAELEEKLKTELPYAAAAGAVFCSQVKYFFCLMILNPFHTLYLSFLCCFFVKKHTDPVLYLHSDVLLRPL